MIALEERVEMIRSNQQAILTSLDWLACDGATPLEKEFVKICRVQSCVGLDVETLLSPKIVSRDDRIQELEKAFSPLRSD